MKNNLAILLILIFAFFLYTFRLNSLPSLYVDEAVVAYDAYSLLHTSSDHYGQVLPVYFRFFGAYTPGLYVYLAIPFIRILGLTPLAVRFPSALCGVLSVYLFYRLVSLFIRDKKLALFSTTLFAILPWTVFNSRLGYEVILAATLFNAGVYFLLKHQTRLSLGGLLLISLSTYAAHTQRYLAPLFLLGYFLFFRRPSAKFIFWLLVSQVPNLLMLFTPAFWVKTSALSPKFFLLQFITYFSPKSLFFSLPDIDLQHQIPQTSVFFWWLIIPLVFGLHRLFSPKFKQKSFLLFWLLISVIPACLTGEFISIQRALPLLFPLMLIISLGLNHFYWFYFLLLPYSLILLFRSYYLFLPAQNFSAWNYGYRQLTAILATYPDSKIMVDNTRNPRNYILPLFYLRPDPPPKINLTGNYYQAPPNPEIFSYRNLTFKPFVWDDLKSYDLIVSDTLTLSPDAAAGNGMQLIDTISYRNQKLFEIFKVK